MNKVKSMFFSVCVMCWGIEALAGQSFDTQEVLFIGTGWGAEGLYVNTSVNNISVDGCGPRFRIDPNHPMLKEMTALLLSAFHGGTKVNLYVEGCVGHDIMKLNSVAISK